MLPTNEEHRAIAIRETQRRLVAYDGIVAVRDTIEIALRHLASTCQNDPLVADARKALAAVEATRVS